MDVLCRMDVIHTSLYVARTLPIVGVQNCSSFERIHFFPSDNDYV